MIALGIESSNVRGMGHLFHALLYAEYLRTRRIPFLLLLNQDAASEQILAQRGIGYTLVDYTDTCSNWEKELIDAHHIDVWFNDKFETSSELGRHVKEAGARFCVIDDVGPGEAFADLAICGMLLPTKTEFLCDNVCAGIEYIILNPEVARFRRLREKVNQILVTLGGSDTYGVTLEVVEALNERGMTADVLVGPDFAFRADLDRINVGCFRILQNLPSLIASFYDYDFAITGGGVTCCEAMASGLPCMVIANEPHEVNTGRFFADKGACLYAGFRGKEWDRSALDRIAGLPLADMSGRGMRTFALDAVERVMEAVRDK